MTVTLNGYIYLWFGYIICFSAILAHNALKLRRPIMTVLHRIARVCACSLSRAKPGSSFRFFAYCSESVLTVVTIAIVVWLLLLVGWAVRGGRIHCWRVLPLAVPDLSGFGDCLLNLLKGFFGLWVAVLIRVKLNGDLVIVLLDILLALLGHALDEQGQWREKELVRQVDLIVCCLFLAAAISWWWTSSGHVDLLSNTVRGNLGLACLLIEELMRHPLCFLIQSFLLLLQNLSFIHFLLLVLVLHSWIELLFLLLFYSFSILK